MTALPNRSETLKHGHRNYKLETALDALPHQRYTAGLRSLCCVMQEGTILSSTFDIGYFSGGTAPPFPEIQRDAAKVPSVGSIPMV